MTRYFIINSDGIEIEISKKQFKQLLLYFPKLEYQCPAENTVFITDLRIGSEAA